nr:hypothetical protein [Leeia aquatica]
METKAGKLTKAEAATFAAVPAVDVGLVDGGCELNVAGGIKVDVLGLQLGAFGADVGVTGEQDNALCLQIAAFGGAAATVAAAGGFAVAEADRDADAGVVVGLLPALAVGALAALGAVAALSVAVLGRGVTLCLVLIPLLLIRRQFVAVVASLEGERGVEMAVFMRRQGLSGTQHIDPHDICHDNKFSAFTSHTAPHRKELILFYPCNTMEMRYVTHADHQIPNRSRRSLITQHMKLFLPQANPALFGDAPRQYAPQSNPNP